MSFPPNLSSAFSPDTTQNSVPTPGFEIRVSGEFPHWLAAQNLSVAFTTYQTNRLFFISTQTHGRLKLHERLFDKPMGLYGDGERLYMSTRYQLWQFENLLGEGETYRTCDRLYTPRITYTTGDLNVHDLVLDNAGNVVFVNTDFSCLATLDPNYSFVPLWQPPFISKLVAEDRCHLNGLAMVEGQPKYVTACSATDTAAGWRHHRRDGGVVIDVENHEIIATGLSMPHSPRWYDGKLWLLNSGTGELGYIDIDKGQFVPIAFCPGFVRGLAFWQNYAVVGLSKLRSGHFTGLALEERLSQQGNIAHCGVMVIDLNTGEICHWLHIGNTIEELFDIVILPGVRQPEALGLQGDDVQRLVRFPNSGGIITTKPTVMRPSIGQSPPVAGLPQSSLSLSSSSSPSLSSSSSLSLASPSSPSLASPSSPSLSSPSSLSLASPSSLSLSSPSSLSLASPSSLSLSSPSSPSLSLPSSPSLSLPSSLPLSSPSPKRVKYQRVYHLTPSNALAYDALTYPSLQKRWQTQSPKGELLGICASVEGSLVGFAIAEQLSPQTAELISLFVLPECRRQGIATKLIKNLEVSLTASGCEQLQVKYKATPLTDAALEPLLQKQNWQPPEVNFLLGKTTIEKVSQAPWLDKYPLPPQFSVFPWSELTDGDRQQMERLDYPPSLSPLGQTPAEALNSLGLRYESQLVGWMVTHRVAVDGIRYSTMFVEKRFQRLGRGISLLAESIRRQAKSEVPYCLFAVARENHRMQRFVERHLAPYLTETTTSKVGLKVLGAAP